MTNNGEFFDMSSAPMQIGCVTLKVRDLDLVAGYYKTVLGLNEISKSTGTVALGSGDRPVLVLEAGRDLVPNDRREAGLFHTAFLMPTRADLARWLRHAGDEGLDLQGAADHIVSEALYLADPEGNGIEVYADRPVARWFDADGNMQMSTDPLDLQGLFMAAGDRPYSGFPDNGIIGHVHLQVGDTQVADRFYCDVLGMVSTVDYPGASFYGSGGYHHQLAGNVWNSRGAAQRPAGMAGLTGIEIVVSDAAGIGSIAAKAEAAGVQAAISDGEMTLRDPWGTPLTLRVR